MITVAVGTYIFGFDELLRAADEAIMQLGLQGFAQTGHSRFEPCYLEHQAFLDHDSLMARLAASRILICHAGMGLIGDGLRAGCQVILYPRKGSTSANNPANDQTAFAMALAKRMDLGLCLDPGSLRQVLAKHLTGVDQKPPAPSTNIPHLLADYLAATAQA